MSISTQPNKLLEPTAAPALGFSAAPISSRRFIRLWLSSYPLGRCTRMPPVTPKQPDCPSDMHPNNWKAFTLVELLVVIAILVALLLPALAKAKARGKAAVCQSNLRQVGLLMAAYVQEHGHYPEAKPNSVWSWLGFGDDWHEHTRFLQCPSIPGGAYRPIFFGSGGAAHQPCLGLAADPTNGPISESVIKAPSDMIGIMDFYHPLLPPLVQGGGPRVELPHSGGIQFLLLDGHVEHATAARFADPQTRRRWNNDNQPHDETW
ncbi:MAG: hypothetical protein JWM16_2959 [Verrucomicrobiales bacterium]|nr:hypothetical protein [Verrucomicrobiales bacterium]